jgi:membrane-associated HD superfamily phosphohydrolase
MSWEWPAWFKAIDPQWAGVGLLTVVALVGYTAWRLSRKIVRWGFFLIYWTVGFLTLLLLLPVQANLPIPPLAVPAIGGFLFASLVMAIRSKVFRVAGAAVTLAVALMADGLLRGHWQGFFAVKNQLEAASPAEHVTAWILDLLQTAHEKAEEEPQVADE